jgi:uncharacterized protein YyaL (SSP411 family)
VTSPLEIAIVVPPDAVASSGSASAVGKAATVALRREVFTRLLPAAVAVAATAGTGGDVTPLLAERDLIDGKATAYVCEHFACRRPVTTPEDLREEIDAALAARRAG